MNCPACGGPTDVIDSRPRETGVRRRRQCIACGHRFSTWEHMLIKARFRRIREYSR